MGIAKGGFLRLFQTFLYFLELCCAGIILGIFSYFLAIETKHKLPIPTWEKAVEGLAGAACLYLLFAILLTCFLGGISAFAIIAILLDLLFVGAFIAIAVLTRHGASSCRGTVNTPVGTGLTSEGVPGSVGYGTACRLNTAVFAVAIIAAFLFLITALMQIVLLRQHKKEKSFGPSPANNYTSGSGAKPKFWQRKNKGFTEKHDAELGAVSAVPATGLVVDHQRDIRPSHDTAYTGSTVAAPNGAHAVFNNKDVDAAGFHHGHAPHVGGYNPHSSTAPAPIHTSDIPTTTVVPRNLDYNPPATNHYGYDSTPATGTAARNF